jgi:hypothetical protein
MKLRILITYSAVLVLYSAVIVIVILAGSHGKLYLDNKETQISLAAVLFFITTSIVNIIIKGEPQISLIKLGACIILNIITIFLLCYFMRLTYFPDVFSFLLVIFQAGMVILGLFSIFVIAKQQMMSRDSKP